MPSLSVILIVVGHGTLTPPNPAPASPSAPVVTVSSRPGAWVARFSAKKRAMAIGVAAEPMRRRGRRPARRAPDSAAGREAEQAQIGRAHRPELFPGCFCSAPPIQREASASASTAAARRSPMRPNSGRLEARTSLDRLRQLGDVGLDDAPPSSGSLRVGEVDGLDAVGALVDRQDARVAIVLGGAGLLDEAHAAVDLHADGGDLAADVGGEGLGDGRQQRGAGGGSRPRTRILARCARCRARAR